MGCKRFLLQVLVIALGMLAAGGARAAGGVDLTRQFLDAYGSDCAFGAAHVEVLRRHKVLLVPGYFGNLFPTYFADQLRWLASIGVEREKVAVRSRRSVAINAPIVAAAIRESARPVILITHSKGSVDALEALRAESSLRTKVKGWVSLQGVFFGSPVANKLLDGSLLDPMVSTVILGFFGGTKESAQSLTTGASLAYYRDHATAIGRLVREVPAIAFASALDDTPGAHTQTLLEIPRELMLREGIRSDGLVPIDAAVLPGMDFVKVSGVDHIAPVMPALHRFDRVRMTKALLLLALRAPLRGLPRDAGCRAKPASGHIFPSEPRSRAG
ncbi:MAG: hypothetical protein OEP48_07525 [Betaproteobacteria bacterium]|nr:hypothetical protein [Betaproteobacteria bacterium]MDH3435378.1 hypothetical protein [Betaproteobacteria bacterium]